ncbi:MAG: Flp pilus assembly protein CpaB [Deltaproteobacteria bacterium]|nr:Flp pilus assembly protein CpaB [Deltaproteobacteria bacterium]MBI4796570.1 Flp pilus assembly protein CpaB [Deltaproteobacteria bacterium]
MRRLPPWLWLLMALVFGAVATFMALGWMKSQSQRQVQQAPKVLMAPVVVAAKDIDAANALKAEQLSLIQWPKDTCPKGGFTNVEEVAGRVAVLPMNAGEPILEPKLAPQGTPAGMVALVSPGKRAMTVKVDEASGVAGFVIPNNRVDVVSTNSRGDFSTDPFARIVLENLRVLGTGQKIIEKNPDGKPRVVPTVTLEVNPKEGERLALAAQEGHLSLVLRSQKDENPVETKGIKISKLFSSSPSGSTDNPEESGIQIIRRQKVESVNLLDSSANPAAPKPKKM